MSLDIFSSLSDADGSRISSSISPQQPYFDSCCGLEWLINSPSKYYFAPRTVTCHMPHNNTDMFVDDLRGRPICPCVFSNANLTSPTFSRQNSTQCRTALSWVLVDNVCVHAEACPPGKRLTPDVVTHFYNCSFVQPSPDGSAVAAQASYDPNCYDVGFDMVCEGPDCLNVCF